MSMNTTFKTWEEMLESIATFENPICLSINYDPDEDEYKLWAGNQPYYFYDDEIEKLENIIRELRSNNTNLQSVLEETVEKLEKELKKIRSLKNNSKEALSMDYIIVTSQKEATSKIYLPNFGDVDVYVYEQRIYNRYLIVIPFLGWSAYVDKFYDFDKSKFSNGVMCGVANKLGDLKINVPELELYKLEFKLIFSLIISLLYKESQNGDRHLELNIEEHIGVCKRKLENCGLNLAYTTFE